MDISIKRVKGKKELEQEIEDRNAEGYKVKTTTDRQVVMEKNGGFGGIVGHAILFVFTLGIGNILYAGYRYIADKKQLIVKIEEK
jgi:hypothetical protein